MTTQKFSEGQSVTVLPSRYNSNARGSFDIIRVLPKEYGMHQYRIKSAHDGQIQVVMECEIV